MKRNRRTNVQPTTSLPLRRSQYQFYPPQPAPVHEALKTSITPHGVETRTVWDDEGHLLDGWERETCCIEIGITCPREVRHFDSEAEKFQLILTLNAHRRPSLSQKQKRSVIEGYLRGDPEVADNTLGAALGVSKNTILAVRRRLEASRQIRKVKRTRGKDGKLRPVKYQRILTDTPKAFEKAKASLRAVYESPYDDLKQELARHGKVDRVLRELERRRRVEEVERQNRGKDFEKVICADCRGVLPTLAAETFDATATDPVFGIGFEYHDGQEQFDRPEDYWAWFRPIYQEIVRVTMPGGLIAIWQATEYLRYAWQWFGPDIHIYIAAKDYVQIRPGAPFTHAYDPIIYYWKPGAKPLLPVYQDRSKNFFVSHMGFNALARCHPCPRPLDLCDCLVRNFTPENGLILDCFAGAGSIPLAVHLVGGGRRSVAIEKNPTYCRLIEKRLSDAGAGSGRN